ncbi:MAG: ribosome biogenesis GTPase Der [Sphaerochaetaceae bacterium]|nr:ribosome biogenesis GTPase Der [Sphaerochaetaceae bacterium]
MTEKIPMVSIIGRPNVGKSTLFNRLVGKRRAITDSTPGVTRDLLKETWLLDNHQITLVDSGGVRADQDVIDDLVSRKSLSLLKDSDVILFLLDCTEVTSEDRILFEKLRPYSDKVILVVNKVDDYTREDLVWNYFAYGYQRVVGISSAHGLGIDELETTVAGMLGLEQSDEIEPEKETLKLAVLGKPNTGKSTFANLLTGTDISLVSDIPGTTRDVVSGAFSYGNTDFTVLDTAGIRRKSKVDEDVEYYSVNRAIKTIDEADVVLLMVDIKEGLAEQDKKIAQLIVRRGRGIVIVLNKIDLLTGIKNEYEAIVDRVRFQFPVLGFAPIVGISAKNGSNVEKVLKTVLTVYKQLNKRVETSVLNTAITAWSEAYQPPRGATGHYKVLYGTQISVNPVRFLLFVNRIKSFPDVYESYLKNCIRRDLGFKDIPIELVLRERQRSESKNALGPKPGKTETGEKRKAPAKFRTPAESGRAIAKPRQKKPGAKNKALAGTRK